MKFYCTVIAILLFVNTRCQEGYDIQYQVKFNDAFDRGRKDRMHTGYLIVRQGITKFYMIAEEKHTPEDEYDQGFYPDTSLLVYTDQSNSTMIAKEYGFDGKPFYLMDSLFPMQWQISNETKMIDSLNCTRAYCVFRGRNYSAWFCPDIPTPSGPWKMGGLPGLIIDLSDDMENLVIRLRSIRKSNGNITMPPPVDYTMKDHFEKMRTLIEKLQDGARATSSGDCISCQTTSKYEFFTWEKIPR
jgi:GLPGLI family protein